MRDILEDFDIADPPDLTEIDPRDDIKSTELGALLWIYTLFSRNISSINAPN